jgi:hypothetical protein
MRYIGNTTLTPGISYQRVDNIGSSFNGVATSFPLLVSGISPVPFPSNPQQCLISVNGVIQKPDPTGAAGFNLVGTNIVFASAPTGGWAFFGVVLAGSDFVAVGASFPDGSNSAPSITFDNAPTTGFYRSGSNEISVTTGGIQRAVFDANGNLAIGASVGNTKIYVQGTGAMNIATLTDGSTITPDFTVANNFTVTLTGTPRTLANPTGMTVGQSGLIYILQDATGSRILSYGSHWKFPGGQSFKNLSTTANAVDLIGYTVRTSTSIVCQLVNNLTQ